MEEYKFDGTQRLVQLIITEHFSYGKPTLFIWVIQLLM